MTEAQRAKCYLGWSAIGIIGAGTVPLEPRWVAPVLLVVWIGAAIAWDNKQKGADER